MKETIDGCCEKSYFYAMKEFASYISIDPGIRFGRPGIKGTRIAISDILKWLASGMTHAEILADYPSLKEEHILAPLAFAANPEPISTITASYPVFDLPNASHPQL